MNEILKCVIHNTQYEFPKTAEQARFNKIKQALVGKKRGGKAGRPKTEFATGVSEFYVRIARDIVEETDKIKKSIIEEKNIPTEEKIKKIHAVRDEISVNKFVKKHIHLVISKNTDPESLIKNWTRKYEQEGAIYEDKQFLDSYSFKMEEANTLTAAELLKGQKQYEIALNEILSCLRKHKWPI